LLVAFGFGVEVVIDVSRAIVNGQASGKGFSKYSGLKSSSGFPFLRKQNKDLVSVVVFQTNAKRICSHF